MEDDPSPSTPATALTKFVRVMSPGKVENHRQRFAKIEQWHARVDALNREHREKLAHNVRPVALVQMLPGDIRDAVCQSLVSQPTHRWIRNKVRALVAKRASLEDSGLCPMHVGGLMYGPATVVQNSISERSVRAIASAMRVERPGTSRALASRKGARRDLARGNNGKDPRRKEQEKATARRESVKFQCTCNLCGRWGHHQAECPSVLRGGGGHLERRLRPVP